jgi:hypothetical protein
VHSGIAGMTTAVTEIVNAVYSSPPRKVHLRDKTAFRRYKGFEFLI